jgi:hypothetical protein
LKRIALANVSFVAAVVSIAFTLHIGARSDAQGTLMTLL